MNKEILEQYIQTGDKLIVWDLAEQDVLMVYKVFLEHLNNNKIAQKIILMIHANENIRHMCEANQTIVVLNDESYEIFLQYYYMYDFSSKVQLIARSSQYATLFHYLDQGIMNVREFVEAILH